MSTYAVVFYEHKNGTYSGFSVKYDGYINNGVGETLWDNWQNPKDVRKLCTTPHMNMRSFGHNFNDLDWFSDNDSEFLPYWKKISLHEVRSHKWYYGYCYIYKNQTWYVMRRNYKLKTLESMLFEN